MLRLYFKWTRQVMMFSLCSILRACNHFQGTRVRTRSTWLKLNTQVQTLSSPSGSHILYQGVERANSSFETIYEPKIRAYQLFLKFLGSDANVMNSIIQSDCEEYITCLKSDSKSLYSIFCLIDSGLIYIRSIHTIGSIFRIWELYKPVFIEKVWFYFWMAIKQHGLSSTKSIIEKTRSQHCIRTTVKIKKIAAGRRIGDTLKTRTDEYSNFHPKFHSKGQF